MVGGSKNILSGLVPPGVGGGKRGQPRQAALLVIVLVVVVVLVLVVLAAGQRGKDVLGPLTGKKQPTTPQLSKSYANPFEPETQYVNPFAEFKSPFQSLQR